MMLQHGLSEDSSYTINQSLRLRASASAYLSRTLSTNSTSQTTMTWSGWVKRGALGAARALLTYHGSSSGAGNMLLLEFADDILRVLADGAGAYGLRTSAVFRDVSAHYHILLVADTSNATASERLRLYVNGVRITAFSVASYPPQNHLINNVATAVNYIGGLQTSYPFDGYLSEINFIDGQALDPSYFGQTDAATGIWVPKKYTGTYGTNGFYLPFNDATSLTTLGYDRSGNGNNFTCNGISITAGATYDVMKDSPTNGPNEVGNYATLNPLDKQTAVTLDSGNIRSVMNANQGSRATIPIAAGKWYVEFIADTAILDSVGVGFCRPTDGILFAASASGYAYYSTGTKANNNTVVAYGSSWTIGDVVGMALDLDSGQVTWYKNNVSQGVAFTGLSGEYIIAVMTNGSGSTKQNINFGQRPFAYTPPTGFKPLHTGNLTAPTIKKPQDHFDVKLDTGANIKSTCEGLFTYFMEWIKDRANSNNHQLIDTVRGTSAVLQSNTTSAETTYTAPSGSSVGWVFNAGSAAVSNTAGSITSQVSANQAAGFSIVTYTGTSANATVGHGLGVAPKMIIWKNRLSGTTWVAFHSSISPTNFLQLNTTDANLSSTTYLPFGSTPTAPTSLVFTVGNNVNTNNSGVSIVAYCFAEIPGYSKFGSYVGNGSADGPFVFCGFRPRFVLIKNITAASDWLIHDTARDTYNPSMANIYAEASNSEIITGAGRMDILSNGFKLRTDAGYNPNVSGNTYIFAAFAESPFSLNNRAR